MLRPYTMEEQKIWFIGYTSRLWVQISFEGWLVTATFFIGIMFIGKINNVANNASLNASQISAMLVEFAVLLGIFYFVTKGHIDKRY